MDDHLPPLIRSEVSARLHRGNPTIREVFAMVGPEFEELMATIWFAGYTDGLQEMKRAYEDQEIPPFMESVISEFERRADDPVQEEG